VNRRVSGLRGFRKVCSKNGAPVGLRRESGAYEINDG